MMKKYIFKGLVLFSLLMGGTILIPQPFVRADSSAWSKNGAVIVHDSYEELDHTAFDNFWKAHMGVHARQACHNQYIAMTPDSLTDQCWFQSQFGLTSPYGNIVRPEGAVYAGLLGESAEKRLIPTPKQGVFLELYPEDSGFTVQFRTLDQTRLTVIRRDGDYLFYDFAYQPTVSLQDATSDPVIIDDNTTAIGVWYAKNGRYMLLANMEQGTISRIDLETFQILTTTYVLPEDDEDRFATFDITSDGEFIAVNLFGREPRLINLQSCAHWKRPYITQPAFCKKLLLGDTIKDFDLKTAGLGSFAVFEDDTTLAFYSNVGQAKYSKFLLFAPGTWQPGNRYIALGDSFASGEGAGDYYVGTDQITGNMCHLSRRSYPFLLARDLRLISTRSVACSGAKTKNIIGNGMLDREASHPSRSNQYRPDKKDTELNEWTPGRGLQNQYIINNQPDIVTVSIGGNDMNFGTVVEKCVSPFRKEQTCFRSRTERAKLVNNMDDQYNRLVSAFLDIKKAARLGARIYVIGYPSTIRVGGKCDFNVKANREEIEFLDAYTMYANTVIRKAARRAGVTFIDMTTALWGYRLCEGLRKAMNGLTLYGKYERRFINPDSYHPNQLGHELFARHIRKQTNDFTIVNPRPDLRETGPSVYDAIYAGLFDSVDEMLEGGYIYTYEEMTGYVLEPHLRVKAIFMQPQYRTVPGAKYEHWLHSDPIFLGESIADTEGNIDATITIPPDAPVGFHTLKTTGKNIDGEDIEIWSNVYVAFSADDWDGNGIPNDQQICPIEIPDATVEQQKEICGDEGVLASNQNIGNNGIDTLIIKNNQAEKAVDYDTDKSIDDSSYVDERLSRVITTSVARHIGAWIIAVATIILGLVEFNRRAKHAKRHQ